MDRSIISNDTLLPEQEDRNIHPITLGSLAILERLGNPCLPLLLGTGSGQLTDNMEGVLEVLYIHTRPQLGELAAALYSDPMAIKARALAWGAEVDMQQAVALMRELLADTDRIAGSMVESAAPPQGGAKKNG